MEPNWHKFHASVQAATTVDEVVQFHSDFLDNCLVQCTLTDPRLVRLVTRLIAHCLKFAKASQVFVEDINAAVSAQVEHSQTPVNVSACIAQHVATCTEFFKFLEQLELSYYNSLRLLLDSLRVESQKGSNPGMAHLAACLDYNGYYTSFFQTRSPDLMGATSLASTSTMPSEPAVSAPNIKPNSETRPSKP